MDQRTERLGVASSAVEAAPPKIDVTVILIDGTTALLRLNASVSQSLVRQLASTLRN
jgi:hypothetical protein